MSKIFSITDGVLSGYIYKKRFSQISFLLSNIFEHRKYIRTVRAVARTGLIDVRSLRFKYLRDYMIMGRRYNWRRNALLSHYEHLIRLKKEIGRIESLFRRIEIWSSLLDAETQAVIVAEPCLSSPLEGELQISFHVNGQKIAYLTFLLVDSNLVGLDKGLSCIIGSLQGKPGSRDVFRQVSKANKEISPFSMLLLSIKAVGKRLGAEYFIAVSSNSQVSLQKDTGSSKLDYSAFWESIGGYSYTPDFYRLFIDNANGSGSTSSAHRRRARVKSQHKELIYNEIYKRTGKILNR